jgi:hypothetical protein
VPCSEASNRFRASSVAPFPAQCLETNDVAGACATACLELAGKLRDDIEPPGSRRGAHCRGKGRFYRIEDPAETWGLLCCRQKSWWLVVVLRRRIPLYFTTIDDAK